MQLRHEIRVAVPPDDAFGFLSDLERVAPCLPGAALTGRDGDTYRGRLKLKVGPATVGYEGAVTIEELDPADRRARLAANGTETNGQGSVRATVLAAVVPDGDHSTVSVQTDLDIQGRAAQFGRGIIQDVSNRVFAQFARNLEAALAASGAQPGAGTAEAEEAPATGAPAPAAPTTAGPAADDTLDAWSVLALPVAKRIAPALVAFLVGLLVGRLFRRRPAAPAAWGWPPWPPPFPHVPQAAPPPQAPPPPAR